MTDDGEKAAAGKKEEKEETKGDKKVESGQDASTL